MYKTSIANDIISKYLEDEMKNMDCNTFCVQLVEHEFHNKMND